MPYTPPLERPAALVIVIKVDFFLYADGAGGLGPPAPPLRFLFFVFFSPLPPAPSEPPGRALTEKSTTLRPSGLLGLFGSHR